MHTVTCTVYGRLNYNRLVCVNEKGETFVSPFLLFNVSNNRIQLFGFF